MSLNYTNQWLEVKNTVKDRLLDDSLLHTLNVDKKIKKQTKFINKKLKTVRNNLRDYKHFIRLKKQVVRTCDSNDETDDEPGLSFEAYKKIHGAKSKSAIQTFLRTCIRTKRKSPTVKRPSLSNANVPKHHVKSKGNTSISNSKNLQSKSNLSNTESHPYQTRFSQKNKIIPATLNKENVSLSDVDSQDNGDEIICNKTIAVDLTFNNAQNEAVDKSLKSDSVSVELAAVQDSPMIENLSEELAASELTYDIIDSSKGCFEFKNESIVSNNQNQEKFIVITDITDASNSSTSNCRDNSNRYNLHSQEDIFMTNDERPGSEENLGNLNNEDKYIDALNFDSGNNSYSDTNISKDEYTKSSVDKAPVAFDYYDKGVFPEHCLNINEDGSIPCNNNFELVNNVIEINGSVDIVDLVNDFDIAERDFRCENSTDDVILSDSYLGSEASQEIMISEPICFSQLKSTSLTKSTTDNTRSGLKTKTIEEYDKGNEIFSKYQSHKRKKVQTVNNSDNKSMENGFPLENEQPLRPRKSSEHFSLSRSELQDSNPLIVHEDCEENKSTENELLSRDKQLLISRKFSEDCNLSQSELQDSDQMIVHEDSIENEPTEKEFPLEDEQRLISEKFSEDCNLSDSDQMIVHKDSIENKFIENEFSLENEQLLISRKFSQDCSLSQSELQNSDPLIIHEDFVEIRSTENELPLGQKQSLILRKFSADCNLSQSELQDSDQMIVHEDSIENKPIENQFPLEDEQPLIPRKFSEDLSLSTLSQIKSQHLNGLINHAEFTSSSRSNEKNVDNFMSNEISLEDAAQSEGNEFCDEYNISAIQPHQSNRSLNSSFSSFSARSYDENFKNSVKIQLLSEIEQRLRDCSTSKKRLSCTQPQTLNGSLDNETENSLLCFNSNREDSDDQFMDNQSQLEDDAESLQSNRLNIHSQNLNKSSNIEDSLLSLNSMPTKRRISNSEKDHWSIENAPSSRKLSRLNKQSTNGQLKLISHERKSQEDISHEMQLRRNEDNSVIKSREEQNTRKDIQSKPQKIPRPQNLEDFVAIEALTQNIPKGHFRPKDISEDDEIWIMEIPKTIHPKDLENKMILLRGKSELKFEDDCYKVSSKPTKRICNISCILTTSRRKKEYKIVNVESKGKIKFRRKLSVIPETELIPLKVPAVQFPKNLKIRHPLFGAAYKDKI